nr:Chain E, cQFD meditope [synthetic construct]4GW1_F Chain F, cQFD meditope [synthetic construct]4IOI_C Chain C, meditope [synthetic construct]
CQFDLSTRRLKC